MIMTIHVTSGVGLRRTVFILFLVKFKYLIMYIRVSKLISCYVHQRKLLCL